MVINSNSKPKTKLLIAAAMALSAGLFAMPAGAVVILPGAPASPTDGLGSFSGTQLYDVTTPYSANLSSFSGNLEAAVYRESDGYLDFVYQFTNTNNPNNDTIETFVASDFSGYSIDADDEAVGGDISPATVQSSPGPGPDAGANITFSFKSPSPGVDPGQSSDILIIHTNATNYDVLGNVSLQDSGQANIVTPEPVPEPASAAMLTLALSALTIRRNRSAR